jgi:hypothetical protein
MRFYDSYAAARVGYCIIPEHRGDTDQNDVRSIFREPFAQRPFKLLPLSGYNDSYYRPEQIAKLACTA